MNLKKSLGKNIQKYRKYRNLTQEKLAELVGVDVTSISAIETGKYFPTAENLTKIVNSLQIQYCDLFEFENQKTNEELLNELMTLINSFKDDNKRLNIIRNFIKNLI